MLNKTV